MNKIKNNLLLSCMFVVSSWKLFSVVEEKNKPGIASKKNDFKVRSFVSEDGTRRQLVSVRKKRRASLALYPGFEHVGKVVPDGESSVVYYPGIEDDCTPCEGLIQSIEGKSKKYGVNFFVKHFGVEILKEKDPDTGKNLLQLARDSDNPKAAYAIQAYLFDKLHGGKKNKKNLTSFSSEKLSTDVGKSIFD